MAWYTDEQYEMIKDSREKKSIAASAHKQRSHCGRGGRVRFPSDNMTKKELNAMNGECKSYRMNDPMSWDEFKSIPDDLKILYINAIRKKYNAPNSAIAEMMDVDRTYFTKTVLAPLKLNTTKAGHHTWDKEGFLAWKNGVNGDAVKHSETPVEEDIDEVPVQMTLEVDKIEDNQYLADKIEEGLVDIPDDSLALTPVPEFYGVCEGAMTVAGPGPVIYTGNYLPVIPKNGTMTFENNDADDALATIKTLLSNVKVNLTISWECVAE